MIMASTKKKAKIYVKLFMKQIRETGHFKGDYTIDNVYTYK